VLRVDQEEQEFVFTDVASEPVPSLLRDFSAPVKMEVKGQTDEDLIFLLAHDTGLQAVYPNLLDTFRRMARVLSVCCKLDCLVSPVQSLARGLRSPSCQVQCNSRQQPMPCVVLLATTPDMTNALKVLLGRACMRSACSTSKRCLQKGFLDP
jgi:hypothetical protein